MKVKKTLELTLAELRVLIAERLNVEDLVVSFVEGSTGYGKNETTKTAGVRVAWVEEL